MVRPKSLRQRVLLLFAILAIGPLVSLGILDYIRARRAVERIILAQTDANGKRAAAMIRDRYSLAESDALLLAENVETQRLLTALASPGLPDVSRERAAADTFIRVMWQKARRTYRSINLRDQKGNAVIAVAADSEATPGVSDSLPPLRYPIISTATEQPLGTLTLEWRASAMLPAELNSLVFGRSGYLRVIDRKTRDVLFDSRHASTGPVVGDTFAFAAHAAASGTTDGHATLRFDERDAPRLASIDAVEGLGWIVLSAATISEFTGGLNEARFRDLALVIVMAITVAILFALLIGRSTRPLEDLTSAAEAIGRGDLAPELPRVASSDEVGTLTGAFAEMVARIRAMMREVEVSRQLAVLGEFSAQLSHEIRNPLTSVKLNLQGLSRDVRAGRIPEHAGPSLETCLREVNRLDAVVHSVLKLARPRSDVRVACSAHSIIERVIGVHEARMMGQAITVVREFGATNDSLRGDDDQLVGMFTNLIVNAIEAQPGGGRVLVRTTNDGTNISVIVADDGAGIRAELGDRVFRPFVTGKPTGTGLGLAMALNVARDHCGTIELADAAPDFTGAAFRVTLPLS